MLIKMVWALFNWHWHCLKAPPCDTVVWPGWDPTWFSNLMCTWELLHRVIALKLSAVLHGASIVMSRLLRQDCPGFYRESWKPQPRSSMLRFCRNFLSGVCWASTTGVKVTGICAKPGPIRTEPGVGVCVCDCVCWEYGWLTDKEGFHTHCCRHLLPGRALLWAELIHSKKMHWKTCQEEGKKGKAMIREMQVPFLYTLEKDLHLISSDSSFRHWPSWALGTFLGPLSRKMAGTKQSDMIKGSDPVSFEKSRTVLYHGHATPRLLTQLAVGEGIENQNLEENSVDICQSFWVELANLGREEEGKALIIYRTGLQLCCHISWAINQCAKHLLNTCYVLSIIVESVEFSRISDQNNTFN